MVEITFPLEFLVYGTPVSLQAKRADSRNEWQERVKSASKSAIPDFHFASEELFSVTIYYFPEDSMDGDVDNIVKPILDALSKHIYVDDKQIERVCVRKFEVGRLISFSGASEVLLNAIKGNKPVVYIKISKVADEEIVCS